MGCSRGALALVFASVLTTFAQGTPPAPAGGLPAAFEEKARTLPPDSAPFHVKRGLQNLTKRAQAARLSKFASGPRRVEGVGRAPVLTARFSDPAGPPYPVAQLQQMLFHGPWPTGTMSDYYREVSSRSFTLTGLVQPWVTLAHDSSYYEGADFLDAVSRETKPCHGVCSANRLHELISEVLSSPENAAIDWGAFDNDGPDTIPNSGDDDGYVDFVAFVHSEFGGECPMAGNRNIWSHTSSLSNFPAGTYQTTSQRPGGGFVMIDDFTIVPALACDGQMIQIGVFAHEFGHAFGLPDLYDTDSANGESAGVGHWCLMSGGTWGGNGLSPDRPAHLSPWAKESLGWLDVIDVTQDEPVAVLDDIGVTHTARRLQISPTSYYLIANVGQMGFNAQLHSAGLQIWKVDEAVIRQNIFSNRVNADALNRGVQFVEADGNHGLDDPANHGEPGDVFPGTTGNRSFDAFANPSSEGGVSVCAISDAAPQMRVGLFISSDRCATLPP